MGQSINTQYRAKGPVEYGGPMAHFEFYDITVNTLQTATFSSAPSGGYFVTSYSNNSGDCQTGMRWFQAKLFMKGMLNSAGAVVSGTSSQNIVANLEVSNQASFPATLASATIPGTEVVATGLFDTTASYGSVYMTGFAGEQTYRFARIRLSPQPLTSLTYDAYIDAAP